MLTSPTDQFIRDELAPGERLLWSGQPRQGVVLHLADAFFIPFSLFWLGFVSLGAWSALASPESAFALLFILPLLLIGGFFAFGRFGLDLWMRRRTYYGVTDRRILILSGVWNRNVRALNLRTLIDISLTLHRGGRGTLTFGPESPFAFYGRNWPGMGRYAAPGFDGIEHPREVFDLIYQAQERLGRHENS
jgi:hypothetical protein